MPLARVTRTAGDQDFPLARHRYPRAHVLSKGPGDPLRLSWPVGNGGPGPNGARAILSVFGPGLVAQGPVTAVPAGAGLVDVGVTWVVDLVPGSYQLVARILEADPGGTPIGDHQFTLNVVAPTPVTSVASYLSQINAATTLADLGAIGQSWVDDYNAGRLSYDDYLTLYAAHKARFAEISAAPTPTSFASYLVQIAAAATLTQLDTIQTSYYNAYVAGGITLSEYQQLNDAVLVRAAALRGNAIPTPTPTTTDSNGAPYRGTLFVGNRVIWLAPAPGFNNFVNIPGTITHVYAYSLEDPSFAGMQVAFDNGVSLLFGGFTKESDFRKL